MILIAGEFTSGASKVLEQSLRNNQSKFALSNIVALVVNNKCVVSAAKIIFNYSFDFNYHNIFYSTKTKIRYRCDVTNKSLCRGGVARLAPETKITGNQ